MLVNEQSTKLPAQTSRPSEKGSSNVEQLVIRHLPLVNFLVNRIVTDLPAFVSKEDLISYGQIGLLDAAQKYNIEWGTSFATYAKWRIRGAIIDGLRREDWLPRTKRNKIKKIEQAYRELEQIKLRSVTDEEVSHYLKMSMDQLHQLILDYTVSEFTSMDKPSAYEDGLEALHSIVADQPSKQPESVLEQKVTKELIANVINSRLKNNERLVVYYYYFERLTMTQIGSIMNVSASRISYLHAEAIRKISSPLKNVLKNS